MAAVKLWAADTAEPWAAVQQGLACTWQAKASDRLQELNSWYEGVLPGAISSRAPAAHITAAELVQLVDWKLTYGKWRPRLLDFAKAASEQQVQEASSKAFSLLLSSSTAGRSASTPSTAAAAAAAAPAETGQGGRQKRKQQPEQLAEASKRTKIAADTDPAAEQEQDPSTAAAAADQPSAASVKAALDALTVLKGVGPATASAALAAADASGSTPYMGDEALQAACGGRDYTVKAYLQLLEALRAKADWLRQHDPGTGWTAVLVERCLFAAALQEKAGPPTAAAPKSAAAAAAVKAAGKPSRGTKASKKTTRHI